MFYISRPAATTVTALIALLRRWAVAAFINDRGPMGPGLTGLGVILCIR
jgi:hypothetical protein